MTKILFHIGYHKTATSWMQQELFISTSKNFFPVSKRNQGPSSFAGEFIYDKEGYLLNSFDHNKQNIHKEYNEITRALTPEDRRVRVISNERLSGNPHSSGFDASLIAQRIQKSFPDSKILIVIREQTSWILSNYFQYLSIGGTHDLSKYLSLKYDGKRPGFSPSHIEYHKLIQDYYNKFGKNNVLVLPYEFLTSDPNNFITPLGSFLGSDLSNEKLNFDKRINTISNHYLNYRLRLLNPLTSSSSVNNHSALSNTPLRKMIKKAKHTLGRIIPQRINDSVKMTLKEDITKWAENRFDRSNRITQEITGMNLEALGYPMSGYNMQNR